MVLQAFYVCFLLNILKRKTTIMDNMAQGNGDDALLRLRDINKTYMGAQPLHVLKGITLDIREGRDCLTLLLEQ